MELAVFFLENPTKEFYESEVKKETEISTGAVNNYLKELASENVLILRKRGKMNFYRLNKDDDFVKQLKITHNMSLPVVEEIKDIGKKLNLKIYLYGSVARGEDTEDSDWDLLVIGSEKSHAIEREMDKLRKRFRKSIKLSIFTRLTWIKIKDKDPSFYERVEKDKIELI